MMKIRDRLWGSKETSRCALFAQESGIDPVGTATRLHTVILVEVPLPWRAVVWDSRGVSRQWIEQVVPSMSRSSRPIKMLGIAPDPEYSVKGRTRIVCFEKPTGPFSRYERTEYSVPDKLAVELAQAIIDRDASLEDRFGAYREEQEGVRDLLVCTHGARDTCCGSVGFGLYDQIRKRYGGPKLRAWRTSHFGGHQFAATALDFPTGHSWAFLDESSLEAVILRRGPVEPLKRHYRGWAGIAESAQIAEREGFLRYGWDWIERARTGRVVSIDGNTQPGDMDTTLKKLGGFRNCAVVRIWHQTESGESGSFDAVIERNGQLPAIGSCGGFAKDRDQFAVTGFMPVSPAGLEP
jgi:hypothetical protein